jgi:hypothetical protein
MEQVRDWKYSAVVFFVGVLAMLIAGAWRELERPIHPAAAVEATAPEQPLMGEPQSNEIADFPQLD